MAEVTSQSVVNAANTLPRVAPSLPQSQVRVSISTQQMRSVGPAGATEPACMERDVRRGLLCGEV